MQATDRMVYIYQFAHDLIMHFLFFFCAFLNEPTSLHLVAAKRVLRYLKGTVGFSLKYLRDTQDDVILFGYSDADWGGDLVTRRSTTGYCFYLGTGSVVSWTSKRQPTVALSSTEAEYMAATAASQEAIYLETLLTEMGFSIYMPITIYVDNQGSTAMTKNPTNWKRTEHIDIRFYFVRDLVESSHMSFFESHVLCAQRR